MTPSVDQHFAGKSTSVRATYDRLKQAASTFGDFAEDPKKTSIHLNRRTAFAGVATRKDAIRLTIKADTDLRSRRIVKREQASSHRWHHEVILASPKDVDTELIGWLKRAYELSI